MAIVTKKCLAPCCLTACLVLVFVPVCVFALSLFFALIMYSIECTDLQYVQEGNISVPGSSYAYQYEDLDASERPVCQIYQWFLYICGNLVGLGNPLTNVSPSSGQLLSEIVDLSVAVWSLAITGSVIGMIGGLAAMNATIDKINDFITTTKYQVSEPQKLALAKAVAQGKVVDLPKFKEIMAEEVHKAGVKPLTNTQRASQEGSRAAVDGWLSRTMAACPRVRVRSGRAAVEAEFKRIDDNGDGYLQQDELAVGLKFALAAAEPSVDAKVEALTTQVCGQTSSHGTNGTERMLRGDRRT